MLGLCQRLLTASTVVVLLASQAFGQRVALQPGGYGYDRLLLEDSVQKELKLTDEQITKIKEIIRGVQQRHQEDLDKTRTLPAAEKSSQGKGILKTISQEVLKDVGGTLKPEQTRRLKQIQMQQEAWVFSDPEVAKALKLTDEQKKKIKTIEQDLTQRARQLFQRGAPGSFTEKLQKTMDLRKEAIEKAVGVLSAEQKMAWKELVGEPFAGKTLGVDIRRR